MSQVPHVDVYRTLLRAPKIRDQAVLGLFAQLTQGAAPVSLVLVVRQASGSLALAGAVSAALWIAAAVARPIQGRLTDRRGTRPVMLVCGPLHAAALIGLAAAARPGFEAWSLVLLSALGGLALPPVSAAMRVEWGRRLPVQERTASYSVVFLTQEVAILIGPLLVAAVVAIGSARLALVIAAGISGAASVAFAARSESAISGSAERMPGRDRRSAAMPALLGATFLLGMTIGTLQVAAPILALARGAPALGGVLIAALSIGGITGALLYTSWRWSIDPSTRLLVLLGVVGVAATPLALSLPLLLVAVLLALVGLGVNPALTTTSLLIDRHSEARAAEGFGWMSTAIGGGTAAGSAAAGSVAQHNGVGLAFLAGAAAAYGAVLVVAVAHGRLSRTPADLTARLTVGG